MGASVGELDGLEGLLGLALAFSLTLTLPLARSSCRWDTTEAQRAVKWGALTMSLMSVPLTSNRKHDMKWMQSQQEVDRCHRIIFLIFRWLTTHTKVNHFHDERQFFGCSVLSVWLISFDRKLETTNLSILTGNQPIIDCWTIDWSIPSS